MYNGFGYQAVTPPNMVVEPPRTVIEPSPVSVPIAVEEPLDSFTINIPNNTSGYTAVTRKRSGNGYLGPQGEFYPQCPTVAHLKVIYGK